MGGNIRRIRPVVLGPPYMPLGMSCLKRDIQKRRREAYSPEEKEIQRISAFKRYQVPETDPTICKRLIKKYKGKQNELRRALEAAKRLRAEFGEIRADATIIFGDNTDIDLFVIAVILTARTDEETVQRSSQCGAIVMKYQEMLGDQFGIDRKKASEECRKELIALFWRFSEFRKDMKKIIGYDPQMIDIIIKQHCHPHEAIAKAIKHDLNIDEQEMANALEGYRKHVIAVLGAKARARYGEVHSRKLLPHLWTIVDSGRSFCDVREGIRLIEELFGQFPRARVGIPRPFEVSDAMKILAGQLKGKKAARYHALVQFARQIAKPVRTSVYVGDKVSVKHLPTPPACDTRTRVSRKPVFKDAFTSITETVGKNEVVLERRMFMERACSHMKTRWFGSMWDYD